jgi:sugar fermentation stimulation protein A
MSRPQNHQFCSKTNPLQHKGLTWPPLIPGTLIKRYKRFMVDVRLDNGAVVTAHCPNTGSMQACCEPGRPVYLSRHDNPKRKLKYTWEIIDMPTSLVGVNTLVPNRLVFESVKNRLIDELAEYEKIAKEFRIGNNSRIDLLLRDHSDRRCYVEIKNCTLVTDDHVAFFPDAVTDRGRKHLTELQRLVENGHRSVMFYLVQRMDAKIFQPASHIDPAYCEALKQAIDHGVEAFAYDVHIDLKGISLNRRLPIFIDGIELA